jgi:hypothetical protein
MLAMSGVLTRKDDTVVFKSSKNDANISGSDACVLDMSRGSDYASERIGLRLRKRSV